MSAVATFLIVAGVLYETWSAGEAQRAFPPPGRMIEVAGYRLHIDAHGEKSPHRPTVILAHGGTAMSAQWAWIQPALARHTQVVAYDRPGLGWSEAAPALIDAATEAEHLYTALKHAEIEGPFLLVGHSLGGLTVQVFAQRYPEETAGLVLIDPVTVERHELLPYGIDSTTLTLFQLLARLGVVRLSGAVAQQVNDLPSPQAEQAAAILPAHSQFKAWAQEGHLGETAMAFLGQSQDLAGSPLLVIEAGTPGEGFDSEQRAVLGKIYSRLAAQSNLGRVEQIATASHVNIVTRQEHAQAIVERVEQMLLALPQSP